MSNQPLLSIAIPTRNRSVYLRLLVEHLLTSQRQDFEIVIQDNSDPDQSLKAFFDQFSDARVHYAYHEQRLTIDLNCDLAIARCTGRYVCMLGDDDGLLLDESLELLHWMREQGIDCALTASLYYAWPSLQHASWGAIGGRLYAARYSGRVESIDVEKERDRVLQRGAAMGLMRLPRVYHGFVSKAALDRLHALAGTYFPGPSPDMANAIGLTRVVERYIYVDFPFIVAGHSKGSGGGMGTERKHRGDISSQLHLPAYTIATWAPEIPFFWSGPTIYAQSAFHAIDKLWGNRSLPLNMAFLYATCLIYEPYAWRETLAAMPRCADARLLLPVRVAVHAFGLVLHRARNLLANLTRYRRTDAGGGAAADIGRAITLARRTALSGLRWHVEG